VRLSVISGEGEQDLPADCRPEAISIERLRLDVGAAENAEHASSHTTADIETSFRHVKLA
jgi:hypothetical protein